MHQKQLKENTLKKANPGEKKGVLLRKRRKKSREGRYGSLFVILLKRDISLIRYISNRLLSHL